MPCSAMLANMASTEKFTKKQVSKPNHLFFSKRTYKIGNKKLPESTTEHSNSQLPGPDSPESSHRTNERSDEEPEKALLLSDGSRIAQ